MTQYFAMINDSCHGPFRLDQLIEAGVTPDTYVWSKRMVDWEKAIDVEEIRDFYHEHLKAKSRPKRESPVESKDLSPIVKNVAPKFVRLGFDFPMPEENEDIDMPPTSYLILAIFVTIMCLPFTGFMAIYYSIKSQREWKNAMRGVSKDGKVVFTSEEVTECKKEAHYCARMAKMWIGITFFIGIIVYATVLFQQ